MEGIVKKKSLAKNGEKDPGCAFATANAQMYR